MKISAFFFVITILIGCQPKQSEKVAPAVDTTTTAITRTDTATITTDTHYFWTSDWDVKMGLVMKKVTPLMTDSLTPPILIQKLNSLYPEIQISYRKTSGDTIFVSINKSRYLTQQVGSSGAKGYLAEVTFNLTELPDVNFVDFNFKQGDHASPGTYSRTDFTRK